MTQPGIESLSLRQLVNTLLIRPIYIYIYTYIYIYIYMCVCVCVIWEQIVGDFIFKRVVRAHLFAHS